jgi:hypothetical protein
MTRAAVLQSNYIPWKGYFDIIHDADVFVFYDDVQYTKNDWRNRNRVNSPAGAAWLTVPTGAAHDRLICEVGLPDRHWAQKHWKTLLQNYSRSRHFRTYAPFFEHVYLGCEWRTLSELNRYLIERIARDFLGIGTRFEDSRRYGAEGVREDRLLDLLTKLGASSYVSGPSAKAYIDESRFAARQIRLVWKSYEGYPEYPVLHPPFRHDVSIVDVLFNAGPDAPRYIWGWREGGGS